MKINIKSLPSDHEILKEIISFQYKKIENYEEEIERLNFLLQQALIYRYGKRSEIIPSNQLSFFDEADVPEEIAVEEIKQADEEITIPAHTRKHPGRKPLPKALPRERVIYDLSDKEKICACGHTLHQIGEDISEKLEFVPAQLKVIEQVRCKYACRACEGGVKMAPLPLQPIPKSIATPGLLSHIIICKYEDHLPLYRQEKILERIGIDLARSTLCFWVLSCAELMSPLVHLLKEIIQAGSYTQADETPVQVLNEPKKSNTSKSYMWVYRGGLEKEKSIVYDYQPSRAGDAAINFLRGFKGFLQTDGYSGYNGFAINKDVTQAGCWAHARRKFVAIVKTSKSPGKAHEAISTIKKLYAIEKEAHEKKLNHVERQLLRQEKAKPILDKFKIWLEKTHAGVPPKSNIGLAIQYAINQWDMLITYIDYGECEIDNNLIENNIRPFALGRKNWLFMGSDRGARAGAVFYSLIATCKLYDIEPYAYFKYVLDQLPRHKTDEERKKLLPHCVDRELLAKAYAQATWDG